MRWATSGGSTDDHGHCFPLVSPSTCPAYLAAYSASEGRLYSYGQAMRINFANMAVTLAGLALSVLYWRFLGMM